MNLPAAFPSPEDVASFQENGYIVADGLVPQDLISAALYGVMRYHAGERDWNLPLTGGFLDWQPDHADGLRINDYVSLQNQELRDLVLFPPLGRAFAALAGTPTIRLFHDQLISKSPDFQEGTGVGWHVDASYWRTCSSTNMLTAWIPLDSYDAEMGGLMVIPGSHRWHGNGWMRTFNERDLAALGARISSGGEEIVPTPLMLQPGSVSFHHGATIHGSMPNRGGRPRVALTVHVQDGCNRHQSQLDCRNRPWVHINDLLCRKTPEGEPDYADPEVCPVLWPR